MIASTSTILASGVPDTDSVLSSLAGIMQQVVAVVDDLTSSWKSNGSALMVHPAAGLGMWPNVQNNLDSAAKTCQEIRKELQPIVDSVSKSASGSFFGLNKSAWKLGMRTRTLEVYKKRLHAHQLAFKLSANMMKW